MNKSQIFGIGYLSNCETLLTVNLKSPHIRTDFLSSLITGTIGAAQLAMCTSFKIHSVSKRSSSASTWGHMA